MLNIVFCIYNYVPEKIALQPWLTVDRVARHLVADGHRVQIITDNPASRAIDDFEMHVVSSLRGSNSSEMRMIFDRIRPDRVIFLITPLNLVTSGWLNALGDVPCYAFASYPFYTARQIRIAMKHVELKEVSQYLRHLLIPKILWRRSLMAHFRGVICQSESTRRHLERFAEGSLPIYFIPPGIEKADWPFRQAVAPAAPMLLYVGGAARIRGFYNSLDAMQKVGYKNMEMLVLARGADSDDMAIITEEIQNRGLEGNVRVIGGWLERKQLVQYIHQAIAVLLPFVLVPSELPVSVMEVIACGTPVITTDIDGLPSTVGGAGIIVPQGDVTALAEAIVEICENDKTAESCRNACRVQLEAMQSWRRVGVAWGEVLAADE